VLSTTTDGEATAPAAEGDGTAEAAGDAAGDAAGEAAGLAAASGDGDGATAGEAATGADVGFAGAGGVVGAAGAAELHPAAINMAAASKFEVHGAADGTRRQNVVTRSYTAPFYGPRPTCRRVLTPARFDGCHQQLPG
jgi:hypothetical protein